ncbi:toxin-antitoxin system YwqK family antitoxin [Pontibacter pamirensis]|uniref:toxin-antitoxin system YwqK family antitoxin n=1 Tax=Pontibacter pamirensis TaxID=2562824 RepID=UPI001F491259|nr:hypothetical protein [Pontibacter pamirensis]
MKKQFYVLCAFVLLPFLAEAQLIAKAPDGDYQKGNWPFRINRFDNSGRFHGRWKVLGLDDKTVIRKGRFRHGRERGTWRYYYPSGKLYMVEKYKRRLDHILVKRYHENGALAKVGQARMEDTTEKTRYFWFGNWKVYDEQGNFSNNEYYENGHQVLNQ